eukprot:CAMPEP_0117471862 /NCGR_PEP_ID=MMETSP0784-20121206/7949_1 /TAXON_ID=39447 /ORGANISM="" /LENGTH=152 /DNA_ID=CAMNT_0005265993 /DNA_START=175 /DNA_END=634 /DNA_ORIENTATION=-
MMPAMDDEFNVEYLEFSAVVLALPADPHVHRDGNDDETDAKYHVHVHHGEVIDLRQLVGNDQLERLSCQEERDVRGKPVRYIAVLDRPRRRRNRGDEEYHQEYVIGVVALVSLNEDPNLDGSATAAPHAVREIVGQLLDEGVAPPNTELGRT